MALNKQPVSITFKQALNSKTDKWQLPTGQFQALTNTAFNKEGLLQKRNGFGMLSAAPAMASTLSKLNEGLVALGNTCVSYNPNTGNPTNAGQFQPLSMSVEPLVRRATSQLSSDVAVSANGTACSTWLDKDGNSYYQVSDSATGQIIIPAVQLIATATNPRAYALGQYFIVTYTATISGITHLQYVAVPIQTPGSPNAAVDLSTTVASLTSAIDGQVYNNRLYVAYAASDAGGAIRIIILDSVLNRPAATVLANVSATTIAVAVDATTNNVWLTYSTTTLVRAAVYNAGLLLVASPVTMSSGITAGVAHLTAVVSAKVLTAIYEVNNFYTYAATIRTDYLAINTLTQAGVPGTAAVIARGVGLASRAAISTNLNSIVVLANYGGALQPSNFLIDVKGRVLARLAYSNAGGYLLSNVLPNINQNTAGYLQVGYRYADQIIPVNKVINADVTTGVYAQYGVNLATFDFGGQTAALEIGSALHPSGGMLWQYDGVRIREHGFNVFPEDLAVTTATSGGGLLPQIYYYSATFEWTDAAGNIHRSAPSVPLEVDLSKVVPVGATTTLAATYAAAATTMTVTSSTGFYAGQTLLNTTSPTSLATGTKITGVSGNVITFSPAAVGASGASDTITVNTLGFTATFVANSKTLSVNTTTGLMVGQLLSDLTTSANIQALTYITSIDTVNNQIGISLPTVGGSAQDILLIAPASTTVATAAIGDTTLTVASTTGFNVGQYIQDITNSTTIPSSTYITAIGSSTTMTISNALVNAMTADTIQSIQPAIQSAFSAGASTIAVSSTFNLFPGQTVYDYTNPAHLSSITTTATAASAATTLAVASSTGFAVGQYLIDATGAIPRYTTITSIPSSTSIVISNALTSAITSDTIYVVPTITAVNIANSTITLSSATAVATASEVIVTSNILANTVNIPTLRLTYKTDNKVRIVVYRWSTANQISYQVSSMSNKTGVNPMLINSTSVDSVAFSDVLADASIIGNNILYTTGGTVENIPAPGASAMVLWQSRLFMASAEDPNLIYFSKQVIEATPVEMSDLLSLYVAPTTGAQGSTGPITALAALDDKLVIFKKDAIYYINGQGPDNTGAGGTFSDPVFITASVGCINQFSVVLTPVGIMFQSDKGIWMLGRDLGTTYIGAPVEDFSTAAVTSAVTVPATNQVRFTLDNGTALMYDYFFQLWGMWSNISAISSVIQSGLHTYLNTYEQIVQETPGTYLDVSTPVTISFTTGWFNLAGLQGFERFYSMNLLGQYISPHKLFIEISYDYEQGVSQTIEIDPINYNGPYGADPIYGSNNYGGESDVEKWRIFPERQKCSSFKITVREVFDPSLGTTPGAGLTLSGMLLLVGIKRGSRTQSANTSAG